MACQTDGRSKQELSTVAIDINGRHRLSRLAMDTAWRSRCRTRHIHVSGGRSRSGRSRSRGGRHDKRCGCDGCQSNSNLADRFPGLSVRKFRGFKIVGQNGRFVFHCVDHVIPASVERLNQLLGRNLSLVSSLAEISAQTQHVFLIRFRRHALSQLFLVNRYDRLIGGGAQNQFQSLVTGEFATLTSRTLQPRNGS